jgi:glycosyltransferase involved in cell wall biosynthesis
MPAVSVILPTFNRTGFLRSAVESVCAQTFTDWELIVADDGSGEETRAYLQGLTDPRVRVLWLEHSGNPSQVRNCGIAAATGHYLAFLDSDDLWTPDKLQKQLAALSARPRARWSYTAIEQIDANGRALPKSSRFIVRPEGWIFANLLRLDIGIAMPTVLAERALVNEAGAFDPQQRFGEFHDLCLRLALKGEVVVVPEPLTCVRTHNDHYSSDRISDHRNWMRLYQKMAGLTTSPELRAHCARMRAETSIKLARQQGCEGDSRGAWSTLRSASAFSWRYPKWWLGALKEVVRPLIPPGLFIRGRSPGA